MNIELQTVQTVKSESYPESIKDLMMSGAYTEPKQKSIEQINSELLLRLHAQASEIIRLRKYESEINYKRSNKLKEWMSAWEEGFSKTISPHSSNSYERYLNNSKNWDPDLYLKICNKYAIRIFGSYPSENKVNEAIKECFNNRFEPFYSYNLQLLKGNIV